jgi:hypothetical protein
MCEANPKFQYVRVHLVHRHFLLLSDPTAYPSAITSITAPVYESAMART